MKKIISLLIIAIFIAGCTDSSLEIKDFSIKGKEPSSPSKDFNEERNAYYGDLHVHTMYSFDAYVFGTTASPDDAYRFAKGGTIKHALGFDMELRRPLDFYGVTDHGFYLGMIRAWADTSTEISKTEGVEGFHNINRPENLTVESSAERANSFRGAIGAIVQPYPWYHPKMIQAYLSNHVSLALKSFDDDIHKSAWADIARSANEHNDPGNFTAFIGYEYTTSTDVENGNLHRNVIFNSSSAPERPFSRIDSINPEDLWSWMDKLREKGIDSIAMPHNSNGSNGQMFEMEKYNGTAINKEYAELRMRNEPIVEMTQVKGTSDTHPLLSPNDEWADFGIMDTRVGSFPRTYSAPAGGYVRDAFSRGLVLEWEDRGNPYKFGLIGSSDTHTAASSFDESNYWSKVGILDGTPEGRGTLPITEAQQELLGRPNPEDTGLGLELVSGPEGNYIESGFSQWGAAGLAGVWAEENTRDSLFQAMRRKETFATSGNRITVRFFAGYRMDELDLNDENMIKEAYRNGVPMGADLVSSGEKVPNFLVWAQRDKNGAPLQRIQIIKGSIDKFTARPSEKVYDVACSNGLKVNPETNRCPDNGASVSIETCEISKDVGSAEIKAVWEDPDFDKDEKAFYYVRVLENPSCPWRIWDAIKAGKKPRPDLAEPFQERAWSSPIWYIPNLKSPGSAFTIENNVLNNN
ncbi:MAG: DUF3604 domain-containing protein [Gammaproteobacteria bacterium]|nr:MAG: DUF3604 domain-containing protein [Gammaproteobacteria bacterium]|tara:strand:- start:2980 stop:5055 length:2076 start_codon:yes stop_codon:yes gene_type:complete